MRLKFLCVRTKAVILLEIVMESPGTHRVKNHESMSIKPMSPSSKKQGAKTLYYSLLKLKYYSPSIFLKHKKRLK